MGEEPTSAPVVLDNNPKQHRPIIFLAYPFRSREDWIGRYVSSIVDRWGYEANTGSRFEGLPISEAVCAAISRSQGMVAFVTKSRKLAQGGWASSDWVLEEIGFAKGRGIPVVVIVESGVDVNLGILSDIKRIELDPKAPYHALIRLRLALQSVFPNVKSADEVHMAHIARPTTKVSGKQWWDFWTWVDAPAHKLDLIASVSYSFPPSFQPTIEVEEDRAYAFGNYGETNQAFLLKVVINSRDGRKQKFSYHITPP
jgi:hypothetical protein